MKKITFLLIVFIILTLESLSRFGVVNSYLLPSPSKVANSACELFKSGELIKHILISFGRVILGFFIAFILGFPLGILLGIKKEFSPYFDIFLNFLRNIPPLSLVPLIIIWFGIGEEAKMIIIILASFFPIFLNTKKGIASCDKKLIEIGENFNFTKSEIFFKIIFPWALADILLGIKLALGYSWRAIIGAEMIAASSGLGYLILEGQQLFRSDIVIVGIISMGVLGIFTDYLLKLVTKKFLKGRLIDE